LTFGGHVIGVVAEESKQEKCSVLIPTEKKKIHQNVQEIPDQLAANNATRTLV
jgi:hypothetical protein